MQDRLRQVHRLTPRGSEGRVRLGTSGRVAGLLAGMTVLVSCAGTEEPLVRDDTTQAVQDTFCESPCGSMVLVPAGPFVMGCEPDPPCEMSGSCEVTLQSYWIDRTEVTQAAYQACVAAGVCGKPWVGCLWDPVGKPTHPAECVLWGDADRYCKWVGKRLPTAAEWEKAARGTDGRMYPWGNEPPTSDKVVILSESPRFYGSGSMPVCSKSPEGDSPYGVCDMAGSVLEWVSTCCQAIVSSTITYCYDPPRAPGCGGSADDTMGQRGGHWGEEDDDCNFRMCEDRCAYKSEYFWETGFRCARDVEP